MTLPSGGRGPGGRWFPADNAERDAIITADGLELDDLCTVLSDGGEYICTDPAVSTWVPEATGGLGDVVGPGLSTDDALARFDGVTGKLLQNSSATLSDSGTLVLADGLTLDSPSPTLTVGDGTATFANIVINALGNTQFKWKQAGVDEVLFQVGGTGDLTFAVDVPGSLKATLYRKATGNWEMPADLLIENQLLGAGAAAADGVAGSDSAVFGDGVSEEGVTFHIPIGSVGANGVVWTDDGTLKGRVGYDRANNRFIFTTNGTGRVVVDGSRIRPVSAGYDVGSAASRFDIGYIDHQICLKGVALGDTAADGPTWFGGTGVPAAGLGANGDFYCDSTGGAGVKLYSKAAGVWAAFA